MVNKIQSEHVFIILIVTGMVAYQLHSWLMNRSSVRAATANQPNQPKQPNNLDQNPNPNPKVSEPFEPKLLETQSASSHSDPSEPPKSYYRYQANTCDPTQDTLPITFPDPNEDLDPFQPDPLWDFIRYGSLSPEMHGTLNYCQ
jgi:hypothetical protein